MSASMEISLKREAFHFVYSEPAEPNGSPRCTKREEGEPKPESRLHRTDSPHPKGGTNIMDQANGVSLADIEKSPRPQSELASELHQKTTLPASTPDDQVNDAGKSTEDIKHPCSAKAVSRPCLLLYTNRIRQEMPTVAYWYNLELAGHHRPVQATDAELQRPFDVAVNNPVGFILALNRPLTRSGLGRRWHIDRAHMRHVVLDLDFARKPSNGFSQRGFYAFNWPHYLRRATGLRVWENGDWPLTNNMSWIEGHEEELEDFHTWTRTIWPGYSAVSR